MFSTYFIAYKGFETQVLTTYIIYHKVTKAIEYNASRKKKDGKIWGAKYYESTYYNTIMFLESIMNFSTKERNMPSVL